MDKLYKELLEQFFFEAKETLQKLEHFFLSYHETLLPEIHREVHTLKGNSGVIYANLPDEFEYKENIFYIKEIIHKYEAILKLLDAGTVSFNEQLEELTFQVIDALNEIIEYTENNLKVEKDYSDLLKKLENFSQEPQDYTPPVEKPQEKIVEFKKDTPVEKAEEEIIFEEIDGEDFFNEQVSDIEDFTPHSSQTEKHEKEVKDLKKISPSPSKQNIAIERLIKKEDFKIIQVKTQKIDTMLSNVSELINLKNVFEYIFEKNREKLDIELKNSLQRLKTITGEIQKNVLKLRLIPVKEIFQKYPRIVAEYSKLFNKRINLTLKGEEIEIDKSILTHLNDILVHIVRNAIDHGIEPPDERKAAGKSETGNIIIQAGIENEYFRLIIADDGRGINPERIKEKVVNKGLMSQEEIEKLNENQIMQLIFLPGFSTKEKVSEISGRGVGLDVVKETVKKLNGRVEVFSEINKGTIFRIYLPISLNIIKTLTVDICRYNFSIPYSDILKTMIVNNNEIKKTINGLIIIFENRKIELLDLGVLLGYREKIPERANYDIIITKSGNNFQGFIIDELIDEQEIVVYQLPDFVSAIPGISGATILGNGNISVVLNLKDLIM